MQIINATALYLIAPQTLPGFYLTVDAGAGNIIVLADGRNTAAGEGLQWTIAPSTQEDRFKICTPFSNATYCLDQYGNNVTQPDLAIEEEVTGQEWTMVSQEFSDGATYWKMYSNFAGIDKPLGLQSSERRVVMSGEADVLPVWILHNVDNPQEGAAAGSSTSPILPATVVATVTASNTATETLGAETGSQTPLEASPGGPGHRVGLIVGIVVGVLMIIGLVVLCWWTRKRRRAKRSSEQPRPDASHTLLDSAEMTSSVSPYQKDMAKSLQQQGLSSRAAGGAGLISKNDRAERVHELEVQRDEIHELG